MSAFTVSNFSVNYRKNPLGIDDPHPRLGWQIRPDARGFVQFAYQIQAACVAEFTSEVVWDSGKIESDRNFHIEYQGSDLKSRTRYYFRVRV